MQNTIRETEREMRLTDVVMAGAALEGVLLAVGEGSGPRGRSRVRWPRCCARSRPWLPAT